MSEPKRTALARALSKLGLCSRSRGRELILAGRVRLNGKICRNPGHWVALGQDRVQLDSQAIEVQAKIYLMLNKPRGLITTTSDEHHRSTVYECFKQHNLPRIVPVGRLDMASEGLLLFTNDTAWANLISSPESQVAKIYHVQIARIGNEELVRQMMAGQKVGSDFLAATRVSTLRTGPRNSWLEVVLEEGKNRHIRRLLASLGVEVLRLVRVAIGPLHLGALPKGEFRYLTQEEVASLRPGRTGVSRAI